MADKKITALIDLGTGLASPDLFHVVDFSSTPINKKVSAENVFNNIPSWLGLKQAVQTLTSDGSSTLPANITSAITTVNAAGATSIQGGAVTLIDGIDGQIKTIISTSVQSTLSNVVITGTAGQFSCNATTLFVGQSLTISGINSGAGSISGYANPRKYFIITTNGSTTFTLSDNANGSAITTTAGAPIDLIYKISNPITITPTNLRGYTNIKLHKEGETVTLLYKVSKWNIIAGNGYVTA